MTYLTIEEILLIHDMVIEEFNGSLGVRDDNLLHSLVERPKTNIGNKEAFEGIMEKTAVYLDSIVNYHVFIDGNKRTATISFARFLFVNGFELDCTNKELENFILAIARKEIGKRDIFEWLKRYTKKI